MKVYIVTIIISGINDKPETYCERIIAGDWTELHELLARVSRHTGNVIRNMHITETRHQPFGFETKIETKEQP
jgi:hypothetical protein